MVDTFNDYNDNNNIAGIVGMRICAGNQIDSIHRLPTSSMMELPTLLPGVVELEVGNFRLNKKMVKN